MTKKQTEMLNEIHIALLHPQVGVKTQMNWLINDIAVNGDKGIENILKSNHERVKSANMSIGDLKEITYTLKTKRDLKIILKKYMDDRPMAKVLFTTLTDKRVLVIIIGMMLTWSGHTEIGNFFISIFGQIFGK